MFARFLCNWPPYRDGQAIEIPDRIGADFVARCMAETVTAAAVREYLRTMETIDRLIDKRISGMPARAGRRVISEHQWRRELGKDQPGYWQAARAHRQAQKSARLPADITVRG
jgi:hypothetical protein